MNLSGIVLLVGVLFSTSCGDGEKYEDPVRIGKAGTLFQGPAGGRDRIRFSDDSTLDKIVSGTMSLTVPKGIYRGTAFPADVTYAVRSTNGALIEGAVSFPRLVINNDGVFEGDYAEGATVVASIVGLFTADATAPSIDIQGFSAIIPTTGTVGNRRAVILQGQLSAKKLEAQ